VSFIFSKKDIAAATFNDLSDKEKRSFSVFILQRKSLIHRKRTFLSRNGKEKQRMRS